MEEGLLWGTEEVWLVAQGGKEGLEVALGLGLAVSGLVALGLAWVVPEAVVNPACLQALVLVCLLAYVCLQISMIERD